jgi:hypothetical protein
MAKQFTQIVGVVLVVVGILGFITPSLGPLMFHTHHNLIHLLSGLVLAYFGFKGTASSQRMGAQIFGIVYGLVTVWGLLGNANLGPITLHLNMPYNIIHLLIAGWGLWAGFAKKTAAATN